MTESRIVKAGVSLRQVPLFFPFKVAYGATVEAELNIVQMSDGRGRIGLGEGAPASYYSSEEKAHARELTLDLAKQCVSLEVDEALELLRSRRESIFLKSPISFVAVEMALWDLRAQQLGQSLCEVFGGAVRNFVETDITLPQIEVGEVRDFWNLMNPYGFKIVKIKVGGDPEEDRARIKEFLKILPSGVKIFLDGNQGLTVDSSLKLLEYLEKIKSPIPLFFEQPLKREAWKDLKTLSERSMVPICLDESIVTVEDVQRCIDENTAPMINLKFMKSGVRETLVMARLSAAAGVKMMIGGMVESEIAMTASLHLMCAVPEIVYADLDTPFFLRERLCEQSAWHLGSAKLGLQEGLGLGLKLKREDLGHVVCV